MWLGHPDASGLGCNWAGARLARERVVLGFGKLIRVHEWSL